MKTIDEVKNDIVQMTAGVPVKIKLKGYGAEQINLNTRNQILSAMTVYGFLSYNDKTLQIPNKELQMKFDEALEDTIFNAKFAVSVELKMKLALVPLNVNSCKFS